jgi:hypothetical protein
MVRATSDNKLLAVYAARGTNGALTLLVINKKPERDVDCKFFPAQFRTSIASDVIFVRHPAG